MRRLICPLLLLVATAPAHARFCDPLPQSGDPGGGGQECTQTRVAHYDPVTRTVLADYSETTLMPGDAVDFSLDLSALESAVPSRVTLLELGIARRSIPGESPGGRFALRASVGSQSADSLPEIDLVWIDGSPTASVADPPSSLRTVQTVVMRPWVVHGEVRVLIYPAADWCHPQIEMEDAVTSVTATYRVDSGSGCNAMNLRSGVIGGGTLSDGMSTWFQYHMDDLIGH